MGGIELTENIAWGLSMADEDETHTISLSRAGDGFKPVSHSVRL